MLGRFTPAEASEPSGNRNCSEKTEQPTAPLVAEQRDEAGEQRDEAADRRDEVGELRDGAADLRDEAADRRDAAAERSEASASGEITADALRRAALARRDAAADRWRASQDRGSGASERTQAGLDRDTALADRGASAREREEDTNRALVAEGQLRDRALFLAEAEHKLKSPLAVLSGWAATLLHLGRDLPESERVVALEAIVRNSGVLAERINRLLEESMAEFRARDLHPVLLELTENLTTTAEALAPASPNHHVRCESGPAVWASVDPGVLFQIMAHLVDNAVKYSAPRTTITLAARQSGEWTEIVVRDEGIGIPEDVDVFAPFERGVGEAIDATPGVGLGLHIVQNLTRAMGGEARAARNVDRGSTFTLRFPCVMPATRSGSALRV
jgi:signal transduction histidine kinase